MFLPLPSPFPLPSSPLPPILSLKYFGLELARDHFLSHANTITNTTHRQATHSRMFSTISYHSPSTFPPPPTHSLPHFLFVNLTRSLNLLHKHNHKHHTQTSNTFLDVLDNQPSLLLDLPPPLTTRTTRGATTLDTGCAGGAGNDSLRPRPPTNVKNDSFSRGAQSAAVAAAAVEHVGVTRTWLVPENIDHLVLLRDLLSRCAVLLICGTEGAGGGGGGRVKGYLRVFFCLWLIIYTWCRERS